ncbi:MAG: hypothetical protein EGR77_00470 [Pseudobutyrivibrio sp.]|nr:hypothetical protein [Pseudobutyrivibrio sp.]
MSEVIMVASGKGGVGKTTLCAMLGTQFARMDKTVVMLDTDFGLRNLDLYFHLENKIIYNLVDVLSGVCSYRQALLPLNETRTLYIMPGSKNYDFKLQEEAFLALLTKLKQQFDIILIDTPAGITPVHQTMLPWMKQCLLVTTLKPASTALQISPVKLDVFPDCTCPTTRPFLEKFADLQDFGRQIYRAESVCIIPRLQERNLSMMSLPVNHKPVTSLCKMLLQQPEMENKRE